VNIINHEAVIHASKLYFWTLPLWIMQYVKHFKYVKVPYHVNDKKSLERSSRLFLCSEALRPGIWSERSLVCLRLP